MAAGAAAGSTVGTGAAAAGDGALQGANSSGRSGCDGEASAPCGVTVHGPVRQADLLHALGIQARLQELAKVRPCCIYTWCGSAGPTILAAVPSRCAQINQRPSHHMRPIRVLRSMRHVSRPRGCWRVIKGWWTQAPVEWVAPTWRSRSLLKAQRLQLALSSTCCQRGRQGRQMASSSSSSTSTSSKGSYCSALKSLCDAGAFVVAVPIDSSGLVHLISFVTKACCAIFDAALMTNTMCTREVQRYEANVTFYTLLRGVHDDRWLG